MPMTSSGTAAVTLPADEQILRDIAPGGPSSTRAGFQENFQRRQVGVHSPLDRAACELGQEGGGSTELDFAI